MSPGETTHQHVLITRAPKDCLQLQRLLDGSNITLRPFPVLRLVEHTDRKGWRTVSRILSGANDPQPWLVLTSPRAARFVCSQAREHNGEALLDLQAAAVGAATAKAAETAGLTVDIVGEGSGTDLASKLNEMWTAPTTSVLAAGVHTRPELSAALRAAGHTVIKLEVYDMRATPARELPPVGPADAIVLTSPRASELYLDAVGGLPLPLVHWALGPTTQGAAQAMGIENCLIPASPSMEDLASALIEHHSR